MLYVLLLILLYGVNICPSESWHTTFGKYDFNEIVKLLGYDPKMTMYNPDKDAIEQEGSVTIYAHGWGDSQESITFFKNNSYMLPSTVLGFNFKDAHRGSSLPPYWLSNFCQTDDITVLLLTIKVALDCGITKIHLFGHSRGGGTILTTLARLKNYTKHEAFFTKLGISKDTAKTILNTIQSIVLNCPLVSMSDIIKDKRSWIQKTVPYVPDFVTKMGAYCMIRFFTAYRFDNDCPLAAAKELQNHAFTIPTMIHVQKDDVIVGTQSDMLLYTYLKGKDTYFTIGDEGGHLHRGKQFGLMLQAFYQKYHAAYYDDTQLIKQSMEKLQSAQPSLQDIPSIAQDLYLFNRSGVINYDDPLQESWQQKLVEYDVTKLAQLLGYDPQIRIYPSEDSLVINNNKGAGQSTTVYVHGLGENAQVNIAYFKLNTYLLPGPVVGFDFPDVIPGTFATNFSKLNLAQEGDIAALVSILKALETSGIEIIHLFGNSRGGGTIINALGRLCRYIKDGEFKDFFERLEISKNQAMRIVDKVKAGTIILNVPLVDSVASARSLFKWVAPLFMSRIAHIYTQHRSDQDQAINAAKTIQDQHFNILVHFEHKDEKVGNSSDAAFYKNIVGPNTYLVLADDGGHLHSGYTLEKAVQAFRKKFNGPYYNIDKFIQEGDNILIKSPKQPKEIDNYITDTYINFELERRKKESRPFLPI